MNIVDKARLLLDPQQVEIVETMMSEAEAQNPGYRNLVEKLDTNNRALTQWREKHVMSELYRKVELKKSEIIKAVDRYQDTYLYEAIMNIVISDALAPSTITNDIVKISSKNSKINKDLQELQERIDIDQVVSCLTADLLSYGEYVLSIESNNGVGVTAIVDDIDQGDIVAVYKGGMPQYFLKKERKSMKKVKPNEYAHFCMGMRKLRIKVNHKNRSEYVRIGRPLMYGTFDLLESLLLMTALLPASHLQKINSSSIIGIQVPESTPPEDGFEISKRYEQLLNKFVSVNESKGEITVSDALNMAGKFKCIPIYGGDRGAMQKVDTRFEEMTDVSVLEDMRRSVLAAVGIPYNFIYGGDNGKSETLKMFARYVRNLAIIHQAIANGLKQIAMTHLKAKGHNPTMSMLEVSFTNKLVNVEELDKIEFSQGVIGVANEIIEAIFTMGERMKANVDSKVLNEFLTRFMKVLELEALFVMPKGIIVAGGEEPDIPE